MTYLSPDYLRDTARPDLRVEGLGLDRRRHNVGMGDFTSLLVDAEQVCRLVQLLHLAEQTLNGL